MIFYWGVFSFKVKALGGESWKVKCSYEKKQKEKNSSLLTAGCKNIDRLRIAEVQ